MKIQFKKGFSLMELLTVTALIGILSSIALISYLSYKKDAEASEGKHLLARIYGAEHQFYQNWNSYHANLVLIGASPVNLAFTNYDAGFDTSLASLPGHPSSDSSVTNSNCGSYKNICSLSNLQDCNDLITSPTPPSCNLAHSHSIPSTPSSTVTQNTFKALAYGGSDRKCWSINEKRAITSETSCP